VSVKGAILVDERLIPIIDIYLDHGAMVIVGQVLGPFPAVDTHDYVIMDRSGGEYVRGVGISGLRWGPIAAGDGLTVVVPLQATEKIARPV
jgi:hypothetical protein